MMQRVFLIRVVLVLLAFLASRTDSHGQINSIDSYFHVFTDYPKPGETFSLRGFEILRDYETRVHREFVLQLTPNLFASLTDVVLQAGLQADLSLTWDNTLGNEQVKVTITDLGSGAYPGPSPGGDDLFHFDFSGMNAGLESVSLVSATYRDLNGNDLSYDVDYTDEGLEVSDLVIHPGSIPEARLGHLFEVLFAAPHANNAVTWQWESGALPAGLTFDATYGKISGEPALGTVGSYPFAVRVTESGANTVTRSFTLSVCEVHPKLLRGIFRDSNGSLTVDQGDEIELTFDEAVFVSTNWQMALVPLRNGDSFGNNPSLISGNTSSELRLILGSSPVLASLGRQSKLRVQWAADGIVNASGNPAYEGNANVVEPVPSNLDELEVLVVGNAIQPIYLNRPPFLPKSLLIQNLPSGLVVKNQASVGTWIEGTPDGLGALANGINLFDQTPPVSYGNGPEKLGAYWSYRVYSTPPGLVEFDNSQVLYPGTTLTLDVNTTDEVTPISASIGGVSLVLLPDSIPVSRIFYLPDDVVSGDLVVTQGANSFNAGSATITQFSKVGSQPVFHESFIWFPQDQVTYPVGLLFVHGYNFTPTPTLTVTVEGVTATVVDQGEHYIVVSLPASAQKAGPITVTVDNGVPSPGPPSFQIEGTGSGGSDNVDPNAPLSDRVKTWCRLLEEANRYMSPGNNSRNKMNNSRFLPLMKMIALHESRKLTDAIQDTSGGGGSGGGSGGGDPGPNDGLGYGLSQMQPNAWCDWMTRGAKAGERRARMRKYLKDKGKNDAFIDCLEEEAVKVCAALKGPNDPGSWEKAKKACNELKSNDGYAAACSRGFFKGQEGDICDCGEWPEPDVQAGADFWATNWNKGSNPNKDKFKDDVNSSVNEINSGG